MEDKLAKTALGASVTAIIASAIALSKKAKASAAEHGNRSEAAILELMEAILAVLERSQVVVDPLLLERLIQALDRGINGYPANTRFITAGRVAIGALNRAYRMPQVPVPEGMQVALKGWHTNAGIIYVGGSDAAAININQSWPLLPSELIWYQVRNLEEIRVSGDTVGDFVAYTVEQRGGV